MMEGEKSRKRSAAGLIIVRGRRRRKKEKLMVESFSRLMPSLPSHSQRGFVWPALRLETKRERQTGEQRWRHCKNEFTFYTFGFTFFAKDFFRLLLLCLWVLEFIPPHLFFLRQIEWGANENLLLLLLLLLNPSGKRPRPPAPLWASGGDGLWGWIWEGKQRRKRGTIEPPFSFLFSSRPRGGSEWELC